MVRKRIPPKHVGFYKSKKRKVNGRKVWKGGKNGLFYAGGTNKKRYIPKKYKKNIHYAKKKFTMAFFAKK